MSSKSTVINGFLIDGGFTTAGAGMCQWAFAKKNGHDFFIKQFISLKYPVETGVLSEEIVASMKQRADAFSAKKQELYQVLYGCRTGNVMIPIAFFREEAFFYLVTEKVSGPCLKAEAVSALSDEEKWMLLSTIAYGFARINKQGVVHSDVKPDNIMIKETSDGFHTAKIIDFDESYFASNPPEEITGDLVYFAPEVILYNAKERKSVDTRADVFSLGLLFHQYWCGKLPDFDHDKFGYACEALLEGSTVTVDDSLPDYLQELITSMLVMDPEKRPSSTQVFNTLRAHRPKSLDDPVVPEPKPVPAPEPKPPVLPSGFWSASDDDL